MTSSTCGRRRSTAASRRISTQGVGRAQQIQFRVDALRRAAVVDAADVAVAAVARRRTATASISRSRVTLSAYGDRTKKIRLLEGRRPARRRRRSSGSTRTSAASIKAANADRIIFTEQDFDEFPDYWVSNTAFASPKKVTDANPILKEYAWSPKKVLVDYTTAKGHKLQGTLMLPAGYEPGKKYPMLVEFYEIMSNTHHNFSMPGYSNSPQLSTYASNGYLVFQPDIVYEIGTPGTLGASIA